MGGGLSGSQHLEQTEYDRERTVFLEDKGYRVLRFWNNDVMNELDGVVQAILDARRYKLPPPTSERSEDDLPHSSAAG